MHKIVTIIGARPQFIKQPLISKEIRKFAKEIVVHTGQHYDFNMDKIFFKELGIPKPDYNLGVGSDTQAKQTAKMMTGIEEVLIKEKPDMVLIYGDTNSTIAGALAAVKLHIPVAHVEAGMRSYNWEMPEEINRVLSDHISSLLLCSTKTAVQLLKKEGIIKGVYFVGDVMADIQMKYQESIRQLADKNQNGILKKLGLIQSLNANRYTLLPYVLATVHRQENTDKKENLKNILQAFSEIKDTVIYPVHPRTRKMIREYALEKWVEKIPNLRLIEPIGFKEMLSLEKNAKLIMTDSGGVQKEAYIARVPCITLRNETEWVETVKSGWNRLAGTDIKKFVRLASNFPKPKNHPNFLGDGRAYKKIAKIIKNYLK